jgi:Hemerythrin HHE cation binding domain
MLTVSQDSPSPAEVRELVLAQHQELRRLLRSALDAAGAQLRAPRPREDDVTRNFPRLMQFTWELERRFASHLAFEERFMFPALREADSWGPQRVDMLTAEHAQQRQDLAALVALVAARSSALDVSRSLESFCQALLVDMEEEEAGYVNRELLRDDVVAIDQASD